MKPISSLADLRIKMSGDAAYAKLASDAAENLVGYKMEPKPALSALLILAFDSGEDEVIAEINSLIS